MQVVVNLNVPASATDYIHRVGRTARAGGFKVQTTMPSYLYSVVCALGRDGLAITLVTQFDIERVKNIESHISKCSSLPLSILDPVLCKICL